MLKMKVSACSAGDPGCVLFILHFRSCLKLRPAGSASGAHQPFVLSCKRALASEDFGTGQTNEYWRRKFFCQINI